MIRYKGSGQLLEENPAEGILHSHRRVFVQFGCFGQECQIILAGMVFVIGDFAVHRPEIDVDIEEVHIYGHLNTFLFQVFRLIDFLKYYDFAVSHAPRYGITWDL